MTKTDNYFVNLGHAIIDCLLKLVGGKALRDKIGHVTYVVFEKIILINLQRCLNLILFLDWNKLANFKTLTLVK
jgi:hypothetical protein